MVSLNIKSGILDKTIAVLNQHYPLLDGEVSVTLEPGAPEGVVAVSRHGNKAVIRFDQPAQACRGIGSLLSGETEYREQTKFASLGIMLDCSRNAVMTVDHFKSWLRQLALLGYNVAMLYTEDTYELPGEEYFGYLRGRYSVEELLEIDKYASQLGIEIIGCIQTLGHLDRMLRWPYYADMRDTASVLMVDDEKSYALIEKMISQFSEIYGSRRIHIGMDETHDLGRGRFMDQHGFERGYDLFNRHLKRVCAICERYGLQPMLWSDMYFRMGNPTQSYYDTNCEVPEDVKRAIPRAAQLVYWDYYHADKNHYVEMIRKHRELGSEPVMASGVWTWRYPWYQRELTEENAIPCVEACKEAGVRELWFTLWGDDGAYCEFDSAFAGLALAAEHAYGGEHLKARFSAVCGADYDIVLVASEMNKKPNPIILLWDDPLLRIGWNNEQLKRGPDMWSETARRYAHIVRRLRPHRDVTTPIDIAHAVVLLNFLRKKIEINLQLDAREFTQVKIKPIVRALDQLQASFRRQWFRRNKPQGFETIQIRLGAQRQRFIELATRLDEIAAGNMNAIPELDECPMQGTDSTPHTWMGLSSSGTL